MKVRSYQDIGHDFVVAESFRAKMLPQWRLASFSLVLPIPESASVAKDGAPFDFAAHGWNYGRDKGIRTIENPMWDPAAGVFRKPDEREGYYGDLIVEGGRPYYNDARSRFLEPLHDAVGAGSIDADVKRTADSRPHAAREVFHHAELDSVVAANRKRRLAPPAKAQEGELSDAGWDPTIAAHHIEFQAVENETLFELVNYDHQVAWEDQIRGARGSHGSATLRLLSAEVLQFHDLHLTDLAGKVPEPAHVVSDFLVLNVVAENISSATLGFLSAALTKPRNSVQFYDRAGDYDFSPPQLYPLTKFTNLAVAQIDKALSRPCSMKLTTSGSLISTCTSDCAESTFTLPAPQRVAVAIPNPAKPEQFEETLSEGNNGSVPSLIDAPLVLDDPDSAWKWHEQWAWQILTGADSYPEQVPLQTPEALSGFVAAKLSSWTVMTSDSGVGMVRSKSASREGMRYWSLASTRFVDIVVLQMRAQAGETHLRKSLKIIGDRGAHRAGADASGTATLEKKALQADLERLEKLQLDHIEIRDKLWFRRVPGRDIDTRVLKGLQRATGFDQLRDDFDTKVKSRQGVIRTQFEQVSGQIAEEEAKRSEAMNLILGFVAAAIGAPDWAEAAGWSGLWGNLAMAAIIFVLMFALVWALQAVFKQGKRFTFGEAD
ncbi:hypothetical protein [Corynebacterium fournieri]|uniref:hypothetical protein n=1 Tax=Corynebacterium fournieri TaxID=1852390 RepID=UPI0015C44069|nr:hypothetical protein [Corynebacterium fournieri]